MKKLYLLKILLISCSLVNSQKITDRFVFESFSHLDKSDFTNLIKILDENKSNKFYKSIRWQYELNKNGKLIYKPELDRFDKSLSKLNILNTINLGDYYLNKYYGLDSIAFRHYSTSFSKAKLLQDTLLIHQSLKRMLFYVGKYSRDTTQLKYYSKLYTNFSKTETQKIDAYLNDIIVKIGLKTAGNKNIIINDSIIDIGIKKSERLNSPIYAANFIVLKGVNMAAFKKNFMAAKTHYLNALNIYEQFDYALTKNRQFDCYMSLGGCNLELGKYNLALDYLLKADKITTTNIKKRDKISLQSWFSSVYEELGDYKLALKHIKKENNLRDSINQTLQNIAKSDLETKYQTAEKEKQILIEQQKKKQNRNIAFGLGGLLLFGGITFLLIQKNTKRKQLIAEQEKELQTQKLATVLKEQELTSIDAMIEGQEKERQRIANDLHDDLGGLMATVKLHFNSLKEKQSPELYKKTDKLLDEAYHKIRSVAHTKNSGVMAKKGLLKAINDMAKTISASNKLQIDVIDHGLEHRLENSLELTIFRIIQELITNIIKHAEATEATIHITNHDDSLNIMVEDNGKGFNPKTISKNAGMGIHSIDKRIENLGGTVTIESEHKKGTTVIIDIPS